MSVVRAAGDADLDRLAGIEDAADALLADRFGPGPWGGARSGRDRAVEPGFVLVVAESATASVVGFAHVLEVGDDLHLEQLAVHPAAARRGHGRALLRAVLARADQGRRARVTLRTYADVPWNAPFYASAGFEESEPDTPFLRGLVEVEERVGLDRFGRRVQMTAGSAPTAPPAPDRIRDA